MLTFRGVQVAAYFGWSYVGANARRVTRVSLSDWLALQARIRGFENPRLLRDRPSDGAAMVCENLCGLRWRIGWPFGDGVARMRG